MDDGRIRRVYIEVRQPTPYRRITKVIDADSGEVLLRKWEDDIEAAFMAGEKSVYAEVNIRQEQTENGAVCRSVTDGKWAANVWLKEEKPIRKRGGKKSYVKLHPDHVFSLPDDLALAVLKLSSRIKVDGLIADEKKRRALSVHGLFDLWGYGRSKGYSVLGKLMEDGVLEKKDNGYYVSREYIARG